MIALGAQISHACSADLVHLGQPHAARMLVIHRRPGRSCQSTRASRKTARKAKVVAVCAGAALGAHTTPTAISHSHLQQQAAQLGVELTPLHANFGAVVKGLDTTKPLSEAAQKLLLAAMAEYDMLLFRGQQLTPADEYRVLTVFPHDPEAIRESKAENVFTIRVPDYPLIAVRGTGVRLQNHFGVTTDGLLEAGEPGLPFSQHLTWHQDAVDAPCSPKISSIYMIQTPGKGDETFSAFERLPEELKQRALQLRVRNARGTGAIGFHMSENGVRRLDDMDAKIQAAQEKGAWKETPLQPLVTRDPDTGKASLMLSTQLVHSFDGLSRPEGMDLLEQMLVPALADSEVLSLRWQPHDFAVWANRRIIHTAPPGKQYSGSRLLHVVFLDSQRPALPANQ